MLSITYPKAARGVALQVYVCGYMTYLIWMIPNVPDTEVDTWMQNHIFGQSGAEKGSFDFSDEENYINWGPTLVESDNWCNQEAISGVYTLDAGKTFFSNAAAPYRRLWNGGYSYFFPGQGNEAHIPGSTWNFYAGSDTIYAHSELYYTLVEDNLYWGHLEGFVRLEPRRGHFHVTGRGIWGENIEFDQRYNACFLFDTSDFYPQNYIQRYRALTSFVRQKHRYQIKPMFPSNSYWNASLQAVDGFHPYDLNLVEGILQFSMEDVCPKGTASSILDILTDAVNSKGGLLSPSGIVAAAQIFANSYLCYKYVTLGDYSDISQIIVGDDKATMTDIVNSIRNIDPDYCPEQENWRLKRIAELIVYRGHKLLSSYGTDNQLFDTELGEVRREVRARLRAWPRYYDDMSTAALICEEFGLSLTAERLVQVVPYEFIAQWFLPIEENIHSIELNKDRLQMMYKVQNLCLSEKVTYNLDDNFLKAMFGLSDADGKLYYKTYHRSSQREFPETALDLNLRPSLTLSKVMQGSSLIISRI